MVSTGQGMTQVPPYHVGIPPPLILLGTVALLTARRERSGQQELIGAPTNPLPPDTLLPKEGGG